MVPFYCLAFLAGPTLSPVHSYLPPHTFSSPSFHLQYLEPGQYIIKSLNKRWQTETNSCQRGQDAGWLKKEGTIVHNSVISFHSDR